jgi:hypothetical protein
LTFGFVPGIAMLVVIEKRELRPQDLLLIRSKDGGKDGEDSRSSRFFQIVADLARYQTTRKGKEPE